MSGFTERFNLTAYRITDGVDPVQSIIKGARGEWTPDPNACKVCRDIKSSAFLSVGEVLEPKRRNALVPHS